MRQKILLLVAVTFGVLAFILTYRQIEHTREAIRGESKSYVLVGLRKDMLSDEELRPEDLVPREVLRRQGDLSSSEILWQQRAAVIGQKLANAVSANRSLLYTDLQLPSRDRSFSARPKPDRRAYSIAVDAVSAVNYLIQPEDKVDVIGTFTLPDYKGDNSIDIVTLTLLQNVKVLATGTLWGSGYTTPGGIGGNGQRAYSTVTLELFPEEVEIVGFAAQKGRLSLSLRNFNDTRVITQPQSVNFKTLLEVLPELTRRRSEAR